MFNININMETQNLFSYWTGKGDQTTVQGILQNYTIHKVHLHLIRGCKHFLDLAYSL